jgi:hypothetical protein
MSNESTLPEKAATRHCAKPLAAALHPSIQLATRAEERLRGGTDGHCGTASMAPPIEAKSTDGHATGAL